MDQPATHPSDDDFDPADALAILDDQGSVARRLYVNGTVLFAAWGTAWFIGYFLLWLTGRHTADGIAAGWALTVYTALLIGAGVVTAVHIARRSRGMRGTSSTTGALYGLSWAFSFVAVSLIIGGMSRLGLDGPQIAVLSNALSCLVVGALYMAGAAMWRQRAWFALGAWVVIVAGVATNLPLAALYLVMSIAGGGGMLVAALASAAMQRRPAAGRRRVDASRGSAT